MDQLLAMGFPEETAKGALEAHGNDLARSLDALLSVEPASTHSGSPEVSGHIRTSRIYIRTKHSGQWVPDLSDTSVLRGILSACRLSLIHI